jgi:hypothetical protein
LPTKIGINVNEIPEKDLQPLVDRIYNIYDSYDHLGELDYSEDYFSKTGKKENQSKIIQDFIDANAQDIGLLYETFGVI